jgi:hypothetical protein
LETIQKGWFCKRRSGKSFLETFKHTTVIETISFLRIDTTETPTPSTRKKKKKKNRRQQAMEEEDLYDVSDLKEELLLVISSSLDFLSR